MNLSVSNKFHYKAYGLSINSCICCPELNQTKQSPDIDVSFGKLPEALDSPKDSGIRFQVSPGELMLNVDGVARFLVRNGKEIIIDKNESTNEETIRLFLLGSALGGLLAQRKHLVLHASVIQTDAGAVAFAGPSGIGKSTLAKAFIQRGYSILSDDLCVLRKNEEGKFLVQPGYPQVKLWADTVKKFNDVPENYRKVRPDINKHALPTNGSFTSQAVPLKEIYVLSVDKGTGKKNQEAHAEKFTSLPLSGSEAFEVIRKNTYRFRFLRGLGVQTEHFNDCANLIANYPVKRLYRPAKGFELQSMCEFLEREFSE